jgi:peptide chain release factor 1
MLTASLLSRLEQIEERFEELARLLSDPEVIENQNQFREFSQEYALSRPLCEAFQLYRSYREEHEETETLAKDSDAEIRGMAQEELQRLDEQIEAISKEIQILLLPRDPDDDKNIYLEIRAGTGGNEAALFAGDLLRMYLRYAELKGWQTEEISNNPGDYGGYKEVVVRIAGSDVFAWLKFESGTHRVQRVPETESQGRIHTSACTIAILPEVEESGEITINPNDLRIDTFRASGAGGQHVNKTDSAIRITHLPSGLVVECQDERSQHKNRARAMALLSARLHAQEQEKIAEEISANRRLQVGSGDRSERIRTYNFPQGRLTDHRINLTLYKLSEILEGGLDQVIEPLRTEHQSELLSQLNQE